MVSVIPLARNRSALREEHHYRLAVLEDFQAGAVGLVIVVVDLIEILAQDRVRTDAQRVADAQVFLYVFVEGRTGDADENQDHAEVDDVAAVAAGVAHGQVRRLR